MIAGYYRSRILTARQPHHIIHAVTSEGLAKGPYVAARGGVEGSDHHHSTNHASLL